MVREARLELAHLAAPEPKSGASTNFATPAYNFSEKKTRSASLSFKIWLGYQDSNLGMPGSKPGALPLGDIPKNGGYDGIRTCDPNIMSVVL